MAYGDFAYWYDALNGDADYDALAGAIAKILVRYGIAGGLVADLGCGTGEVTLRLAAAGYDMIAVDASPEMLSVLRNKAALQGREDLLLLCQPLEELDLFGTIRAAVSTFDTFNHLDFGQLEETIRRAALFLDPGGLLVFDVNTLYKHREVLGNNTFTLTGGEDPELVGHWRNRYDAASGAVTIEMAAELSGKRLFEERITEYLYEQPALEALLEKHGLHTVSVMDGEDFGPPKPDSQRLMLAAKKH